MNESMGRYMNESMGRYMKDRMDDLQIKRLWHDILLTKNVDLC